jgi:hypothetical protein
MPGVQPRAENRVQSKRSTRPARRDSIDRMKES